MQYPRLISTSHRISYEAFRTDFDSEVGVWLDQALTRVFGQTPIKIRTSGGSIPIAPFVQTLGIPAVTVPTVNRDNNQHSPNENLRLGNYLDAIRTYLGLSHRTYAKVIAMGKIRVAAVQSTPQFFDTAATLESMRVELRQCAQSGCQLVLYPESYLPGYPRGMTFGASVGSRTDEGRALWQMYWEASVQIGDEVHQALSSLAKEHSIHLAVGVTERDQINSSLYCSLLIFDPSGALIGRHRKIKPTGTERIIWAEGDGSSLHSIRTSLGRLGGLICWENLMPEARLALYRSGIDIYLAPTADARGTWTSSMRHIACESRCFVISCNQFFLASHYPPAARPHLDSDADKTQCRGGSVIVSPLGEVPGRPHL